MNNAATHTHTQGHTHTHTQGHKDKDTHTHTHTHTALLSLDHVPFIKQQTNKTGGNKGTYSMTYDTMVLTGQGPTSGETGLMPNHQSFATKEYVLKCTWLVCSEKPLLGLVFSYRA